MRIVDGARIVDGVRIVDGARIVDGTRSTATTTAATTNCHCQLLLPTAAAMNVSPASQRKRKAEQAQASRKKAGNLEKGYLDDFRVAFVLCSLLEDPPDGQQPDPNAYKRPVTIATEDCPIGERHKEWADSNDGQHNYCFMDAHGFFDDDMDFSAETLKIPLVDNTNWNLDYLAPKKKVWKPDPTDDKVRIINDIHHLHAAETMYQLKTNKSKAGKSGKGTHTFVEDKHDTVEAIFFTQENIHKAVMEKGLHLTQKFLSDNVDMLVLCGDAYFSNKSPKEGTSGDVPSGTFVGTFMDLISGMRTFYNVAMCPPLHVVGFCNDKHARNKGIEHHRVPTTYLHLPLLTRGPFEANDDIPEDQHFVEFYKDSVRQLLNGGVISSSAVPLAVAYKDLFAETDLLQHGIVAKPTGRSCGVGVLFIKPLGQAARVSLVTAVEVREFVDNRIIASLSDLTIGGDYPVQHAVEPFVPATFLKEREFRTFCTPRRADRFDSLYQVKTSHDANNRLGLDSLSVTKQMKPFLDKVWAAYRNNNKRFRTDCLKHVVFRIDSFCLSEHEDAALPDIGRPMLVNEIEVFPMCMSFLCDAHERNEQITALAIELKNFIILEPLNYPV